MLRSQLLDIYASHILPYLKAEGIASISYICYVLEMRRKQAMAEALSTARTMAETIELASEGRLDDEVSKDTNTLHPI